MAHTSPHPVASLLFAPSRGRSRPMSIALAALSIVLFAAAAPASAQVGTLVYDNLDVSDFGDFTPFLFEEAELADEITLAPGPRALTSLRLAPGASVPIARFDLILRFYEVGVNEPGPLIWENTYPNVESFGGAFLPVDLPIPEVVVPDSFIWSVEVVYAPGFQDATAYLNAFSGPVLGSSGPFVWVDDHPSFGPDWVQASSPPCSACVFNLAAQFRAIPGTPPPPVDTFVRGDVNIDGSINIADAVFLLEALFVPNATPTSCADAGDINDDATVNIADAVTLLNGLFVPGEPAPPNVCASDPTVDALDCADTGTCP